MTDPVLRTRLVRPLAHVVFAGALIFAGSCSTTSRESTAPSSIAIVTVLNRVATEQTRKPDSLAMLAPPPAGVDAESLSHVSRENEPLAFLSLEEVLAAVRSAPPEAESKQTEVKPDALRAYVAGRSARLSNDLDSAETDLTAAARIDPDAMHPWRELAEVQLQQGNSYAASTSFKRALARDPEDIRTLEQVSAQSLLRDDLDTALPLLAQLEQMPLSAFDPALPFLNMERLGRALNARGYLTAAAEAFTQAADLPNPFTDATIYRIELSRLYLARSELLRLAADNFLRTGDTRRAEELFSLAARLPSRDTSESILRRRVFALMRAGQSAGAGLLLIESISDRQGHVTPAVLDLLGYVASNSRIGNELEASLRQIAGSLDPQRRRVVENQLAIARSAVLPAREGHALILQHVESNPTDEAALSLLFKGYTDVTPAAALSEAIRLTSLFPMENQRFGRALFRAGFSPGEIRDSWSELTDEVAASPAAVIIRARILAECGAGAEAASELSKSDVAALPLAMAAANLQLRIGLLLRIGDLEESLRASAHLAVLPKAAATSEAIARVLIDFGRLDEAITVIDGSLRTESPATSERSTMSVLAGGASERLSEPQAARTWFEAALDAEPTREEAFAGLIRLTSHSGPLANDDLLIETIRRLQDAAPFGPLVGILQAQEAIARGRIADADVILDDLATRFPDSTDPVELYVSLHLQRSEIEQCESWLRDRIEEYPAQSSSIIKLADVLIADSRAREAADILKDHLVRFAGDREVTRKLESVLRDRLDQPNEADRLALRRLAMTPRSAWTSLERLEIHSRQFDLPAIRNDLDEIVWDGKSLPDEYLVQLDRILAAFLVNLVSTTTPREESFLLAEDILKRRPELPTAAHAAAIQLALVTDRSIQEMLALADHGAASHPEDAEKFYQFIFGGLFGRLDSVKANQRRYKSLRDDLYTLSRHQVARNIPDPPIFAFESWILVAQYAPFGAALTGEDAQSLSEAVGLLIQRNLLTQVLGNLAERKLDADLITVSNWALSLADFLASTPFEEHADELYLLAITSDPNNRMARNNYGYRLLEANRDFEEAHRYITEAYELMERQGERDESIIDSLGWVRYKLGMLHDEPINDAQQRRGAIHLLQEASELVGADLADPDSERSAVGLRANAAIIRDHLGDALWASGERQLAIDAWRAAADSSKFVLDARSVPIDQPNPSSQLEELRLVLQNALQKIDDARADRRPAIAPMIGSPSLPGAMPAKSPTPVIIPPPPPATQGDSDSGRS